MKSYLDILLKCRNLNNTEKNSEIIKKKIHFIRNILYKTFIKISTSDNVPLNFVCSKPEFIVYDNEEFEDCFKRTLYFGLDKPNEIKDIDFKDNKAIRLKAYYSWQHEINQLMYEKKFKRLNNLLNTKHYLNTIISKFVSFMKVKIIMRFI